MQNRRENECYDEQCEHNTPYRRPHIHVRTPYGVYVEFIIETPKKNEYVYNEDFS